MRGGTHFDRLTNIDTVIRRTENMRNIMPEWKNEFACIRERSGLSYAETAQLLHCDERSVRRYENAKSATDLLKLEKLKDYVALRAAG